MTTTLPEANDMISALKSERQIIDCDVHTYFPSVETLLEYLPERWRDHHKTYGASGFHSGVGGRYPRRTPLAARKDSWPPAGGLPGSDLKFMCAQHLDPFKVGCAVLGPMQQTGQRNGEYAQAVAAAVNDWTSRMWLDEDSRLRGSIVTPFEQPLLAAEEIERIAPDKRFVQVYMQIMTSRPLGNRLYWPIYETAIAHNLPVGIHFGGGGGNPRSGAGWPSYYLEDHAGNAQTFQTQVVSLICEGVFELFPALKIVLIEGGMAWLPSLAWRLDRAFERFHTELPHLTRRPSEYIRDNIWLTTQPIEEPPEPTALTQLIESFPSLADRLLFASDYPHWDFDAPDHALRSTRLPKNIQEKIISENAAALYALDGK